MFSFLKTLARLRRDEKGASLVEYGVALLVIAGVGVTMMSSIASITDANITDACTNLELTNTTGTRCP